MTPRLPPAIGDGSIATPRPGARSFRESGPLGAAVAQPVCLRAIDGRRDSLVMASPELYNNSSIRRRRQGAKMSAKIREPSRRLASVITIAIVAAILPSRALPVEYVKICSLYGTGYYYEPGTDVCVNPQINDAREPTAGGTWEWRTPNNPRT